MKTLVKSLQNLLLVLFLAGVINFPSSIAYGQEPMEDPEFDPEIHIQPFQTSYLNQEIMPQNDTNN